jgi:hypothetical protein
VLTASILVIEAVSIAETSVHFYQYTGRNILEGNHLHNHRRENPKYHKVALFI